MRHRGQILPVRLGQEDQLRASRPLTLPVWVAYLGAVRPLLLPSLVILLPLLILAGRVNAHSVASRPAKSIARILYVRQGLTVRPPGGRVAGGRTGQWLSSSSLLRTGRSQAASLRYPDRTDLIINASTQLDLPSADQTHLTRGEVAEALTPGTQHDILTPVGLVHAIGTSFDVSYRAGTMTVVVVEGAVTVSDIFGSVIVETGQQTTVLAGSAPKLPTAANVPAATGWAQRIPAPRERPAVNAALAANGGHVVGSSSSRAGPPGSPGLWDAANVIDGRLNRGWQSASGQTANQFAVISFPKAAQFTVTSVVLDCAATGGEPSNNALRSFDLRVSGDLTGPGSFKTVFTGTCRQTAGLQVFRLRAPVMTRFLMLYCKSNWGGTDGIAVAEIEVVSPDRL
jgi:hypothetical protein